MKNPFVLSAGVFLVSVALLSKGLDITVSDIWSTTSTTTNIAPLDNRYRSATNNGQPTVSPNQQLSVGYPDNLQAANSPNADNSAASTKASLMPVILKVAKSSTSHATGTQNQTTEFFGPEASIGGDLKTIRNFRGISTNPKDISVAGPVLPDSFKIDGLDGECAFDC